MTNSQLPPKPKQLSYLGDLAKQTGETFPHPTTRAQASAEIERMKSRKRLSPAERRYEALEALGRDRCGHVVDAALVAGVRVPYACKGGICCTCRAKVIEGHAKMTRNYSLEPWEIARGFILTCQGVTSSKRLVLDYDQM